MSDASRYVSPQALNIHGYWTYHEHMDTHAFGAMIKAGRKQQNMTQDRLADLIGKTQQTISRWESGRIVPDDRPLVPKLAQLLHISEADLTDAYMRADRFRGPDSDTSDEDRDLARRLTVLEAAVAGLVERVARLEGAHP